MTDEQARRTMRQMIADWTRATEADRQAALEAAARAADEAERGPRWLKRAAGKDLTGAVRA